MNDFSLIEKIKILMDIILSSPAFLIAFFTGLIVLVFFIVSTVLNKKVNKWIFIGIWGIAILLILIFYHSVLFSVLDAMLDYIFMALYFPNLLIYVSIFIISNFFFIYSILKKDMKKSHKIINVCNAVIINLFLIFIGDIVSNNNINIIDSLDVFTNYRLMVLLQLNSAVFISCLLLNLFASAHYKLQKYDKKEEIKLPEIIFD